MYKLKQKPEDFIVKEIPDFEIKEKGKYHVFLLKKTNYTTEKAINEIAYHFHIKPKYIGYAGIKDKKAVTEQYISINILNKSFPSFRIKDIEVSFLGYNDEPIYIGRLKGNEFIITIRNLNDDDIERLKNKIKIRIPNLYGEQRFSSNNIEIGKSIIKRDFRSAVKHILEGKGAIEKMVRDYIEKHSNDYIGAIRKIPLKLRKLYIHSFQSELFNNAVLEFIKSSSEDIEFPVLGFGTEFKDNKIKKIYERIMRKEGITLRDFIIRSMPEMSSAGFERNMFVKVNDLKIIDIKDDELNKEKKKVVVSFSLAKGSYATVAIDYLMRE